MNQANVVQHVFLSDEKVAEFNEDDGFHMETGEQIKFIVPSLSTSYDYHWDADMSHSNDAFTCTSEFFGEFAGLEGYQVFTCTASDEASVGQFSASFYWGDEIQDSDVPTKEFTIRVESSEMPGGANECTDEDIEMLE